MKHEERLCAAYVAAMEVLAKPWSGLLIAVLQGGPLFYRELSEQLPAIGDRMLAARLKELEARGLVSREVITGPPVRVRYALTDAGRGYENVASAISTWGALILSQQCAGACAKKTG